MSTLQPAAPLSTKGSSTKKSGDKGDVSSPHELTAFVEDVLTKLDTKFDAMSSVVLEKTYRSSWTQLDQPRPSPLLPGRRESDEVINFADT
ncbi:hypothetical protein E3P99_04137, partial [Wallemia hederae]